MINITPERIDELMDWISGFTEKEDQKGTTRLLYDASWVRAQQSLKERFEELGMEAEFDAVGNLIATLRGSEEPDSIIATGSHVDTVTDGGRLDGQLGIMAGYMAVKGLIDKYGQPKKSLRVIALAEEEGSRFPFVFWGSKNIFGLQNNEEMKDIVDNEGVSFVDAMKEAGFGFNETGELKYNKMDAFLELHIEQGIFLEQQGIEVGIVNAIVGQKRYDITLKGEANHAGTTLMGYRKDTVECFSRIVVNSIDKAKAEGDPLVLTFGHVSPKPNTVNVVPGETMFTIDVRHTDSKALDDFTSEMEEDMKRIASDMGIEIDINNWMTEEPTQMDEGLVELLEEAAKEADLNYTVMHSGAGHDSQIFAQYVPTAMIFVPSIKGISHNPEEHTEAKDIVQGVELLAEAIRRLAY